MKRTLLSLLTMASITTSCEKPLIQGENGLIIKESNGLYHVEYDVKYFLGDYVSFNTPYNGSGEGVIVGYTIGANGVYDYQVEIDEKKKHPNGDFYPVATGGIYDVDITLIKQKLERH
jgi:hypothetical protein